VTRAVAGASSPRSAIFTVYTAPYYTLLRCTGPTENGITNRLTRRGKAKREGGMLGSRDPRRMAHAPNYARITRLGQPRCRSRLIADDVRVRSIVHFCHSSSPLSLSLSATDHRGNMAYSLTRFGIYGLSAYARQERRYVALLCISYRPGSWLSPRHGALLCPISHLFPVSIHSPSFGYLRFCLLGISRYFESFLQQLHRRVTLP